MNENIFTLPNKLTFIRIFISIIATGFIISGNLLLLYIAIILIAYSELTDIIDGYIARRDSCVTNIGKLLDPLSDSISRFMYFFAFGFQGLFPIWLVLVLFIRDIIVAYIRTYMSLQGIAMGARLSGKIKALVQFIGQYLLLFMLAIILLNQGNNISETFILVLIFIGSMSAFFFFKFIKLEGKYLFFSILGYLAFLIPTYMINKIDMQMEINYPIYVMLIVVSVTLWSLWDYISGLLIAIKN